MKHFSKKYSEATETKRIEKVNIDSPIVKHPDLSVFSRTHRLLNQEEKIILEFNSKKKLENEKSAPIPRSGS